MNIGKDFPKMKRGRPRLLSPSEEAFFRGPAVGIGQVATLRTVQNKINTGRGLGALCGGGIFPPPENKKRFNWLLTPCHDNSCRGTIVGQLGRVKNPDAQLIFADRLCVLKPTAAEAVKLVRQWQGRWEGIMAAMIAADREPDAKKVAHRVCERLIPGRGRTGAGPLV